MPSWFSRFKRNKTVSSESVPDEQKPVAAEPSDDETPDVEVEADHNESDDAADKSSQEGKAADNPQDSAEKAPSGEAESETTTPEAKEEKSTDKAKSEENVDDGEAPSPIFAPLAPKAVHIPDPPEAPDMPEVAQGTVDEANGEDRVHNEQESKGERRTGLFQRLVQGLSKTRTGFVDRINQVLRRQSIDDDLYNDLEEVLIQADVGMTTATKLVDAVRKRVAKEHVTEPSAVEQLLREEMVRLLQKPAAPLTVPHKGDLTVFLVVGVNGAGKTTTIGKLAARYHQQGLRTLLGAADTFRAAAIDQLEEWSNRAGVELVKHQEGSDPASVAYDSVQAAKARKADVLIVDTAGRLQTKTHLMQELSKINRVIERELGRKPDEVLLVLDATTGQNGMSQARLFSEVTPITGVVLTKLDGTARGGIVLPIATEMELPVKLITIGEKIDDLRDFDAETFVAALFAPAGGEGEHN